MSANLDKFFEGNNVMESSRDVVDFVVVPNNNNNNNIDNDKINQQKCEQIERLNGEHFNHKQKSHRLWLSQSNKFKQSKRVSNDGNEEKRIKEKNSFFSFGKKLQHQKTNVENSSNISNKLSRDNVNSSLNPSLSLSSIPPVPIGTPPRQHKFIKSSSIGRILGSSTFNAKSHLDKDSNRKAKLSAYDNKFKTFGGRRRSSGPYLERFKHSSKDDADIQTIDPINDKNALSLLSPKVGLTENEELSTDQTTANENDLANLAHFHEERIDDLSSKAFRTLTRGFGKLWWKRSQSVNISTPDREYKVSYLGNVLTGWAKGEGCVEKQLNTLWRNYTQNSKPDVVMRIKVCASGLKATTRQHGLTEYWANRITHCCAPKNYPRVFCWIYRHEGRKLKHELRCHAVLCSKEKIAHDICNTLKGNLESALREFKREKILKQNARLSLANAVYDNPTLPRRKIMLSVGGNNYRPPLERSKSAPKLMAIEEAIGEEDGDDIEETNEPEMKACCQKDSLYPAMTLGRRRCRRGHSIRRTGTARPCFVLDKQHSHQSLQHSCPKGGVEKTKETAINETEKPPTISSGQRDSFGSDDSDDFEKLLKHNNYDSKCSLTNELLPYFDIQLHKKLSSSLSSLTELKCDMEEEPVSLSPTINSHPSAELESQSQLDDLNEKTDRVLVGLRCDGVCSDGENDYVNTDEEMYFREATLFNMLHRNSMRKMAQLSLSSDENSSLDTNNPPSIQYSHATQPSISSNTSSSVTTSECGVNANVNDTRENCKHIPTDSDEGSISSGCETASTVTANQDDISLKYHDLSNLKMTTVRNTGHTDIEMPLSLYTEHTLVNEDIPVTTEEICRRLESRSQNRHNSDATTFSSSSSTTIKVGSSNSSLVPTTDEFCDGETEGHNNTNDSFRSRRARRTTLSQHGTSVQGNVIGGESDSEFSDESGYVEYQERQTNSDCNRNEKPTKMNKSTQSSSLEEVPPKPMPRRIFMSSNTNVNTMKPSASPRTTTAT